MTILNQSSKTPKANFPEAGMFAVKSPSGKVCFCTKSQFKHQLSKSKFEKLGVHRGDGTIEYDEGVEHADEQVEVKAEVKAEVVKEVKAEVEQEEPVSKPKKDKAAVPGRPPKK